MFDIAKYLLNSLKKILKNYYTYVILLLFISTYFTLTPFLKNTFQTPPNRIYLGAENDYSTYFKYLKLTFNGQNLNLSDLKTKISQISPVEKYYLISGKIGAIFAMSQFSVYHLFRLFINFLFFLFLYLILSRLFKSRPLRLATFSIILFVVFPILIIVNYQSGAPWAIVNFFSYPHFAFLRLLLIIFIFIFIRFLRSKGDGAAAGGIISPLPLIPLILLIGFFLNSKIVSSLKIDLKKDPNQSALIYPSKDFYEAVGYLRDNGSSNEKVVCLKRCSALSEIFAGISPIPGTQEEIAFEMANIFDSVETQTKFQKENAVYWFIGPEEKPLISPDFTRLTPKEVFKNKEVTIFRLDLKPL